MEGDSDGILKSSGSHFVLAHPPEPGTTVFEMNVCVHIPCSLRSAATELRAAFAANLGELSKPDFIRAWAAVAYLFPNLHPDEYDNMDGGWPQALRRFAFEAWERADAGEISDSELYQSDSQWCGIYDRLKIRMPDEIERRIELAAL
jgi:hypothetical protein